jgi:two-component system, chemotaxis family, sensor kinase CheA
MTSVDPSETFRQEAQDLLVQLEDVLLDMETSENPHDLIATAFRALHTLKGSGSMFGFQDLAAFAHVVENTFDRLRKSGIPPSAELVATSLSAKDYMRQLVLHPETAEDSIGEALLAELQRLDAEVPMDAPAPPAARRATYEIDFALPEDCLLCGTNPLLLLDELRELGDCEIVADASAVPLLDDLDPEMCTLRWHAVLTTDRPQSAIEEVFMFVLDEMTLSVRRLDPDKPAKPAPAPAPAPAPGNTANFTSASGAPPTGIRVAAERVDSLMDRVGELVIAQSRLRQIAQASHDPTLRTIAEEIERLAGELRGATMGIRMIPIGQLFGRFRRVVHDLARDLGKSVNLVTVGEETELDKTVIESLNDPMLHLIRNAIDHGFEEVGARAAAGKPTAGTLTLSARHAGAQVLITIADDGRGMDRERIRAKAVEAELLPEAGEIPDSELFAVIFSPGFSTAAEVTSVSGRGVGMDVVKRTIDGLRGFIEVASEPGAGSAVTLRLPLTLAIIDGLLVRVGSGRYVIPLSSVEECVELPVGSGGGSDARNLLNIRGDLVPFLRLREMFAATVPPDPYQKVVIVASGDQRVGLVVDQIIGDHQTVIKSLSRMHADVPTFSGATILGDGTVALILDIVNLIAAGRALEQRLKAS